MNRVVAGSKVFVERKIGQERLLLGSAVIRSVEERPARDGKDILYAHFTKYEPFVAPLAYPVEARAKIEALPNFNVQHAITYITADIYREITGDLNREERTELLKE